MISGMAHPFVKPGELFENRVNRSQLYMSQNLSTGVKISGFCPKQDVGKRISAQNRCIAGL